MTLPAQPILLNERFVVFLEDALDSTKRSAVALELAELYGVNEEKFERLLSKHKKVITKPIPYQQASKLQWYLKKISVNTSLIAEEDFLILKSAPLESEKGIQEETSSFDSVSLQGLAKDRSNFSFGILALLYVCLYASLVFLLASGFSLWSDAFSRPLLYIPYMNKDLSDYNGQNFVLGISLVIILLWVLSMLVPVHKTTSWFISLINKLRLPMIFIFILLICVELASLMGVFG